MAAAKGARELAARLSGARDALHASLGLGLPPAATAYAGTVAGSRAALGNDAFTAAHENGQSCSLDRAVAEVMAIVLGETNC